MKLPKHNLWDSVESNEPVNYRWRWMCPHAKTTSYVRTDHRPGPGWMSDSYAGTACCDCGKIITETKVY